MLFTVLRINYGNNAISALSRSECGFICH